MHSGRMRKCAAACLLLLGLFAVSWTGADAAQTGRAGTGTTVGVGIAGDACDGPVIPELPEGWETDEETERKLEEETDGKMKGEHAGESERATEAGHAGESEKETEAGHAGESEKTTEAEAHGDLEEEAEKDTGIPVLADTNGEVEVHLYAPDGHFYPVGTTFRVLDIADAVGECADKEAKCQELAQSLRDMWKEGLQGERAFFSYYLMVKDETGAELDLPDAAAVHIIIRNAQFYEDACARMDHYRVACLGKGNEFVELKDVEILRDDQEQAVILRVEAKKMGWMSILQSEGAKLDAGEETEDSGGENLELWGESEVPEETEGLGGDDLDLWEEHETQTETEGLGEDDLDLWEEHETQTETEGLGGEDVQIGDGVWEDPGTGSLVEPVPWQDPNLGEENQEQEYQLGDGQDDAPDGLTEDLLGVETASAPSVISFASAGSSGTPVTSEGSGFVKMMPKNVNGAYRASRWYAGITSYAPFNNAGASVKAMKLEETFDFFYPLDETAKGKFGAVYKKILYFDGVWYDLKITVENYTNQTYTGQKGELVSVYPPVGFSSTGISFRFKDAMGEVLLKMEYFENGKAYKTASPVKTRFQWWDVDNAQRFGLRMEDGSIQTKYYQSDDCLVYYQKQTAVVDKKQYFVVTAADDIDGYGDKRGNVGFALKDCSTYYLLIGETDKIKESPERRVDKEVIARWKSQLLQGNADDLSAGILIQSDLEVAIPPDKDYPKKAVSNDGESWAKSNTLTQIDGNFYYRVRQYVPWEDPVNYFDKLVFRDELPAGVDFVGKLKIVRLEDGKNVTKQFTTDSANDVVTAKATDNFLANKELYGYTYDLTFQVRMDPGEMTPAYQGNTATYTVKNKASVRIVIPGDDTYNTESNEVTTTASVGRATQQAPMKRLDANPSLTEKTLSSAAEEIVFSIYQTIPANAAAWLPSKLTFTDTLADCLEYRSAAVYVLQGASYVQADGFAISAAGQTVTAAKAFRPSDQTFRLDIRCAIRSGYDMQAYRQVIANRYWCLIPNRAQVELAWEHGDPQTVSQQTNEVVVKVSEGPIKVRLTLTKEIDTADIVWAHGRPTFTFCVSGEDLDRIRHTYYDTVEFTPDNVGSGAKATLSTTFTIPAGWYTATEEKTVRYRLNAVHSVQSGSAAGDKAVFDLSATSQGAATFYNIKTTDEGESHSAFVRNVMAAR